MLGVGFLFAFAVLSAICSEQIVAYRHVARVSNSKPEEVAVAPSDGAYDPYDGDYENYDDSAENDDGNLRGDYSNEYYGASPPYNPNGFDYGHGESYNGYSNEYYGASAPYNPNGFDYGHGEGNHDTSYDYYPPSAPHNPNGFNYYGYGDDNHDYSYDYHPPSAPHNPDGFDYNGPSEGYPESIYDSTNSRQHYIDSSDDDLNQLDDEMPKELPANAHKEMHTQEFRVINDDDDLEEQAADKSIPVEKFKVKSEWYEPGVSGVAIKPLEPQNEVNIKHMRIENINKEMPRPTHIPRLYDDDKGIEDMLRYAPVANRRIRRCQWLGKDYIVALDDSAKLRDVGDYEKVRSFVKMLAYSLSATVGTNTLSLVSYDKTAREVLGRTIIDKDNIRSVAVKIDEMFDSKNSAEEANPGAALKFLREKVYEDGEKYLVDDKTSEMRFVDAPGIETIVFLITTGKVADEALASNEAFNARRNGVTLFVVEIGNESEKFWPAVMGCRYHYACPKYFTTSASNIMGAVGRVITNVCRSDGRDAVCLEAWSDYTPCSVPCGSGVQTANLLGFTQLLGPSNGEGEGKGRSCKDLLKNVKVKQVLCNTQRCGTDASPIAAVGGVDSVGHASTGLPSDGVSGIRTDEAENVMSGTRNNEVAVGDAANSANVGSQNSDSLAPREPSASEPREVAISESDLPKEGDELTVHRETESSVSTSSEADLPEPKGESTPHSESTVVVVHEHNVRDGLGGQNNEESTGGRLDVGVTQAGGESEREVSSGTTHEHQQMENQALVPDTITSVLPTTESESARNPEEEPASQETELTEQLQSEQLENGTTGDESITAESHTTGSSTNTIEGDLTSGLGTVDSGSHVNVGDHTQVPSGDSHHGTSRNTGDSAHTVASGVASGQGNVDSGSHVNVSGNTLVSSGDSNSGTSHNTGDSAHTVENGVGNGQGNEDLRGRENEGSNSQVRTEESQKGTVKHEADQRDSKLSTETEMGRPADSKQADNHVTMSAEGVPTHDGDSGNKNAPSGGDSKQHKREPASSSVPVKATQNISTSDNHTENRIHGETKDEQSDNGRNSKRTGTGSVVMMSAAGSIIIVLLAGAGYRRYASNSDDDVIAEDSEFLSGVSGGKAEEVETYRVADASDNVWA